MGILDAVQYTNIKVYILKRTSHNYVSAMSFILLELPILY